MKARLLSLGLLFLVCVIQAWHIFPYTRLSTKQVPSAEGSGADLKILIANVYQENRKSERLLTHIADLSPDLVLAMETDDHWVASLKELQGRYPHAILQPQDNTYGMALYSRFPLEQPEVRFLVDEAIPSIRADFVWNGQVIRLYAVHPRPPGLVEKPAEGPNDTDERDAELILVAREARAFQGPVIVAGDFNDVAWSHTTRLFQRISKLLDPRIGRGLYNTYHAQWPFLRFPLDHLFHSRDFQCAALQRLDSIGSDHFPMLVTLQLAPEGSLLQEEPREKPGDMREADKILENELDQS